MLQLTASSPVLLPLPSVQGRQGRYLPPPTPIALPESRGAHGTQQVFNKTLLCGPDSMGTALTVR